MKSSKNVEASLATMLAEATLVALIKSAKVQKLSKEVVKKKAQALFNLLSTQEKDYGGVAPDFAFRRHKPCVA